MTGKRGRARLAELGSEPRILPSLLSADFADLGQAIAGIEAAGAEVLHLDIMDGHFVPNITFGPPLVRSIRAHATSFLDAHLMITDPLRYLAPFAEAGADLCTVHAEVEVEPGLLRSEADRLGIGLGVALRPSTPLGPVLERWTGLVDLILVMSVEPGFGGQAFDPGALDRLREVAAHCRRAGAAPRIEVDGGIGEQNLSEVVRAGGEWLVAGHAVFRRPEPAAAWRELTETARSAAGG